MPMTTQQITLTRQKIADPGTNASQAIEIDNATGGSWTITFSGQTTTALAWDAGANDVQNALAALSNVGLGNVSVNEQPGLPGSLYFVVYFGGVLGNVAQPMLTVNNSLTGTNVIVTVSLLQAGGVQAFTDSELNANYDLAQANFFLGIAYDIDDLMVNSSRFNRYTAGQSQEYKDQIFDHLKIASDFYHQWANADRQVQFSSLRPEPPRIRAVPRMVGVPATSLNYQQPFPRRFRNGAGGWWD